MLHLRMFIGDPRQALPSARPFPPSHRSARARMDLGSCDDPTRSVPSESALGGEPGIPPNSTCNSRSVAARICRRMNTYEKRGRGWVIIVTFGSSSKLSERNAISAPRFRHPILCAESSALQSSGTPRPRPHGAGVSSSVLGESSYAS